MIRGSCLCGAFRFELNRIAGPFELCHCSRCRKVSGGMGMPMIGVEADDFRVVEGNDAYVTYEAPLLDTPPRYHVYFCRTCGTALPTPNPTGWFEIPAGLFDDEISNRLDRRIYVEHRQAWEAEIGEVPALDREAIGTYRRAMVEEGNDD